MAVGLFYGGKQISGGSSNFELKEWNPLTSYTKDEYAYINDNLYQVLLNHTSTSDFEQDLQDGYWKLILGSLSSQFIEEDTNPDSTKYIMAGDKVISGTKKTTNTDAVTGTITEIEQTPNYTIQTKTTITTDSTTGETTKTIEIIKGNSDGIDVSSASGTKQTIITDSTGAEILNETENVQYENGQLVTYMTEDEVKNMVDTATGNLGWD